MLKSLHGLVEKLALNVYRKGALQLGAEVCEWEGIQIVAGPSIRPKIFAALEAVRAESTALSETVKSRLKTIISTKGVITKTFPVSRTFVVESDAIEASETRHLAYLFVRSAAYIDFYVNRLIFLPNIFFKKRDHLAKSKAEETAMIFRTEPDGLSYPRQDTS